MKDEHDDLLVDSHNILNRWKNYFQLLNMHSDVRQIEMHTPQPLVHDPSPSEVKHKLPPSD
jgi:hypothetical protein